MIYIAGLGASDVEQLPLGVVAYLKKGYNIFLRTDCHPMVTFFKENNIAYTSFDSIYEKYSTFEKVYEVIIQTLLEKERQYTDILYCVPGHPCVAEYTVKVLLDKTNCKIVGGQSFLDSMFAALKIDPIDGLQVMDALNFEVKKVNKNGHLFIPQVFDQLVASNLKLDLMEIYPDDQPICIVKQAGSKNQQLKYCKLFELDYDFEINNLLTVYIPPIINNG